MDGKKRFNGATYYMKAKEKALKITSIISNTRNLTSYFKKMNYRLELLRYNLQNNLNRTLCSVVVIWIILPIILCENAIIINYYFLTIFPPIS